MIYHGISFLLNCLLYNPHPHPRTRTPPLTEQPEWSDHLQGRIRDGAKCHLPWRWTVGKITEVWWIVAAHVWWHQRRTYNFLSASNHFHTTLSFSTEISSKRKKTFPNQLHLQKSPSLFHSITHHQNTVQTQFSRIIHHHFLTIFPSVKFLPRSPVEVRSHPRRPDITCWCHSAAPAARCSLSRPSPAAVPQGSGFGFVQKGYDSWYWLAYRKIPNNTQNDY